MVVAVALIGSLAGACDGPRGVLDGAQASNASSRLQAQNAVYRLERGDKLKITVFNEPDLTGEFQVNDSGQIAFPLIGNVDAAGASVNEFQSRLATRLRGGYVRNPRVSVEVTTYRPFNVFGEVRNSGQFPFRPGLTVQDAVAMAGGFTYRANVRTAYIQRAGTSGEITVHLDGKRVPILPGDNIRIPERFF